MGGVSTHVIPEFARLRQEDQIPGSLSLIELHFSHQLKAAGAVYARRVSPGKATGVQVPVLYTLQVQNQTVLTFGSDVNHY